MVWIIIVVAMLLLLILSLFTHIHTYILYTHIHNKSTLQMKIRLLGIIVIKKEFPVDMLDIDDKSNKSDSKEELTINKIIDNCKQFRETLVTVFHSKTIVARYLTKVKVKKFKWNTQFGIGDAGKTGILTGVVWGLKSGILKVMIDHMRVKDRPIVNVFPVFQHKTINVEFECMVSVRLGQTMYAIIQLVRHFQRDKAKLTKRPA
ncbi:DUF2953 domain-containing protein [Aquibacillus kalidii]|uniref:DUF2953 domain-containing protein n=1 Tax=Aquibacillus kalidii TaxID=2762597 RepID=UPI0016458EB5|nr:DUF2953 domain-containing protein [Aquibacillus kalidii]